MKKSKKNKAKINTKNEETKVNTEESKSEKPGEPIPTEDEATKAIKSVAIPQEDKDTETSESGIVSPEETSVLPVETSPAHADENPKEASGELKAEKSRGRRLSDQLSDDEAFELLGPESIWRQLTELLLGMVPVISAIACFLWITLGGTVFSVSIIAIPGAAVLALFLFWALGGCKNVNRRRFARAYFLWLVCIALIGAIIALLAYAFGAELSPILRKIMSIISSLS